MPTKVELEDRITELEGENQTRITVLAIPVLTA